MINPSRLKTFNVDVTPGQHRFQGAFTAKKLSIRDISQLGVRKTQLNQGLHYDPKAPGQGVDYVTDELNAMIAHLELAIVSAPAWWNLEEMTDLSILSEVYQEVISFENSFHGGGQGRVDGGVSEAGSSQAGTPADNSGRVTQVVGQEVPSSLEP